MSAEATTTARLGLHEDALEAGLDLLERQKNTPPTLSAVAKALDVPRSELDRLFPSPEALFIAAGENALRHLIDSCTRAVVRVDPSDAVGQFRALGEAYLRWAQAFPRQYRMLTDGQVVDMLSIPQLRRYSDSVHNVMLQMLTRARQNGQLHPREDVELLAFNARTFAHGLARMIIDGRVAEFFPDQDPLEAGLRALEDFVRRMARAAVPAE